MEEPDLGQLDGEVAQQNEGRAFPLLFPGGDFLLCGCQYSDQAKTSADIVTDILDLVFVEGGYGIDDDPREGTSEVNQLVHDEAHDSGRKGVILHPEIPSLEGHASELECLSQAGDRMCIQPRGARHSSVERCTWTVLRRQLNSCPSSSRQRSMSSFCAIRRSVLTLGSKGGADLDSKHT